MFSSSFSTHTVSKFKDYRFYLGIPIPHTLKMGMHFRRACVLARASPSPTSRGKRHNSFEYMICRTFISKCSSDQQTKLNRKKCKKGSGTTFDTPQTFWGDSSVWQRAATNTTRCLVGCSLGDFSALFFLQSQ